MTPTSNRATTPAAAISIAVMTFGGPAMAQGEAEDRSRFPTTEFAEDAKSAAVTVGNVTAGVSQVMRPDVDPSGEIPILNVIVDGKNVLTVPGVGSGLDFVAAQASIAEIDPENAYPEVYFSSYTGGAHCCNAIVVAEELDGSWAGIPIGEFDGDGNYLEDADGDGLAEIVTVDNRFLYAFDCYACSAAPLTMTTIRRGKVLDVSADPRYVPAHREWLAQIESFVDPAEQWKSPGYLAGWVAAKIRVGEGAEAWQQLSSNWDAAADAGEEVCLTGQVLEECPARSRAVLTFPERLRLFLEQTGYLF